MLKHCSMLSLDSSNQSIRHSRLSLAWEDSPSKETVTPKKRTINTSGRKIDIFTSSTPLKKVVELNDPLPRSPDVPRPTSIKVHAQCLRPHLAYKTVVISGHTTSKQVVLGLLSRFRMRHRDPNLYYLTMEVTVGTEGQQTIVLEDNARPVEMISCNPWASPKFILQTKQGGLVKVFDHLVRPESVYKSLIISQETTVQDTIEILRSCYREDEDEKSVYLRLLEVGGGAERLLGEEERPLKLMEAWTEENSRRFLLRSVARRRKDPPKSSDNNQSLLKKRFLWSMLGTSWGGDDCGSENESDFNISSFSSSSSSSSSDCQSTSSCESSFLVLTDGFLT